ncbi:hypothetical protein HYT05_03685 [Candidatus Kaiserbacteria bacterium]|nr:hypothetical protein [Candidatus Kaiserbacteria bacterium]
MKGIVFSIMIAVVIIGGALFLATRGFSPSADRADNVIAPPRSVFRA